MSLTIRARTMTPTDDELLTELERFLEPFRGEFRRQDQLRRAAAYLLGLLRCPGRKNIENLARASAPPADWGVSNTAQALQHFVNQSPWNEDNVLGVYLHRSKVSSDPAGVLVVSEQTYLKQGRHSVGVQRQYSSSLDRKVNCQLAVALHHVGARSFVPLGVRLYLPRGWQEDNARLTSAGVPAGATVSKAQLALEMLDRALAEGWTGEVALSNWAGPREELRDGVKARGLEFVGPLVGAVTATVTAGERRLLEELGLDHFEGRSWRGFHHHACLVLLAHAYLRLEAEGNG